MSERTQSFHIAKMPVDLVKKVQVHAILSEVKISQIISEALHLYFEQKEQEKRKR